MSKKEYGEGKAGKCPHCQISVCFKEPIVVTRGRWASSPDLETQSGGDRVYVYSSQCPNCQKPVVVAMIQSEGNEYQKLVHPSNVVRNVPPEVPKEIQNDFLEAAAVLPTSEKASAALSRRCLQNLLTDRGHKQKDLNEQIEAALKDLPQRIADNLDAIRNIGNFAAHAMKYQSTGAIADVEPEEANWNLDVLEELFEHYYVQPTRAEQKRKTLETKLKALGKPPLKKP